MKRPFLIHNASRTFQRRIIIGKIRQGDDATRRRRRKEGSTRFCQFRRKLGRVQVRCGTKGRTDKELAARGRHGEEDTVINKCT
jgi:hypothetical protein